MTKRKLSTNIKKILHVKVITKYHFQEKNVLFKLKLATSFALLAVFAATQVAPVLFLVRQHSVQKCNLPQTPIKEHYLRLTVN